MRRIWHWMFGHPYDDMVWVQEAGGYACESCREGMGGYRAARVRPYNPTPGACDDPTCPVLHADPANPIHPPSYRPGQGPQRRAP